MDHQKVEQTLKKIFDRYGRDIVKDHSRFRSAVMDLLDPVNCKDERIVLKHAMDIIGERIHNRCHGLGGGAALAE